MYKQLKLQWSFQKKTNFKSILNLKDNCSVLKHSEQGMTERVRAQLPRGRLFFFV